MDDSTEQRRYTDREVGLVLKRAAELEEQKRHDVTGRGLTKRELHDIGREVGLSSDVLDAALAELQAGRATRTMSLLGTSPSTRVVRAVPGAVTREGLQQLVQLIEDRIAQTGTVTEALGSIRWTSVPNGTRVSQTTQVAFTPAGSETQIQVTHRFAPKFRTVVSLLPTIWGSMIGVLVAAATALPALPFIGVVGGAAVLGGLTGRTVWQTLAARAHNRAESLANEIASVAATIVGRARKE